MKKSSSHNTGKFQDLYSGLIRLHILHHAAEEPIFGFGILEELARHGYRLSAGTLYPLLHGMEKKRLFTVQGRVFRRQIPPSLSSHGSWKKSP